MAVGTMSGMGIRLRWVLLGVTVGCALTTGAFLLLRGFQVPGIGGARQTLSPPAVLRQIQQLNQLVTVKYATQQAVGFEEKKVPLGSERMLLFVQAEVIAGIELDKLQPADLAVPRSGTLVIRLPEPRILHIVIDDEQTKVWDRRITWWTPWVPYNADLERQARLAARAAIEKAALEMDILETAQRNAETAIRQLAGNLGFHEVSFLKAT
jgi:hypothetical protein